MMTLILTSGSLPPNLQRCTSVDSILKLSAGLNPVLRDVVHNEQKYSTRIWIAHSGDVPVWWPLIDSSVNWVEIDSSPNFIGDSARQALRKMAESIKLDAEPLRVVFGDTICSELELDTVAVGVTDHSEDWTFAPQDFSSELIDSRASRGDHGVVCGAFSFADANTFLGALEAALIQHDPVKSADPFFEAIRLYSNTPGHLLSSKLDAAWRDFGHLGTYLDFRKSKVAGRAVNNFDSGSSHLFIQKTSTRTEKITREALWFRDLPPGYAKFVPRVMFDEESSGYGVQFVRGVTLAEKLLYGQNELVDWGWITGELENWFAVAQLSVGFQPSLTEGGSQTTWFKTHFTKRFEVLLAYSDVLDLKVVDLNRLEDLYFSSVERVLSKLHLKAVTHGDLIFSNVLVDESQGLFKLIDPRGGFETGSIFGPQLYDWAKLAQSIFGRYEEILAGQYIDTPDGFGIAFADDSNRESNYREVQNWFDSSCPHPNDAKILAGILLLTALEFHSEDPRRMRAMIAMGQRLMRQMW